MKYYYLLLSLLLSGIPAAQAQTPAPAATTCTALSGYVLGSGKPLAGVTVAVEGTRQITITNGEGFFTLNTANVAQPKLQFSAAGYEAATLLPTSCSEVQLELQLLPGTRIKQRGKRKGFIMKTDSPVPTH